VQILRSGVAAACVVVVALAFVATAQTPPIPPGPPPPPTPYPPVITSYAGRLLEVRYFTGPGTGNVIRADFLKVDAARDRLYMRFGRGLAVYRLSTLFERLNDFSGIGGQGERFVPPDLLISVPAAVPEIGDFDWDSRGYLYISYYDPGSQFGGVVIVDSNGVQRGNISGPEVGIRPSAALTIASTSRQYLVVSNAFTVPSRVTLFDVTSPSTPSYLRDLSVPAFNAYARTDDGLIGIIRHPTLPGTMKVFTSDAFVSGGPPTFELTLPASFADIASDGRRFFLLDMGQFRITVVEQVAGIFRTNDFQAFAGGIFFPRINYGENYLTISRGPSLGTQGSIYRVLNGVPTFLEKDYFNRYPGWIMEMVTVRAGNRVLLIIAGNEIADVFVLEDPRAIPTLSGLASIAIVFGLAMVGLASTRAH